MRLKFIEQGNAKDGKTIVDTIPPLPYLGFLLRITGTTTTGETLTLADIGDIRIERSGDQIQAQDFEFYHNRTDLKSGFPKTVSGSAATAEDVVAFIPFFYSSVLPNVLDVQSKENLDVTLDFDGSTLSTRFDTNSCTYELFGVVEEAVAESYVMDIRTQDIQATSSGRLDDVLTRKNIAGLILEDPNDKVDEVQIEIDEKNVWDNIDQDVITIMTNLSNQIESSGNTLGEINLVETGDIREAYNTNNRIQVNFNGSGTLGVTIFSVKPSPVADISAQRREQYLAEKQARLAV